MPKLSSLQPQVATLAPVIGYANADAAAYSQYRRATQPCRVLYDSARWKKLRWQVLVRDLFRCTKCQRIHDSSQLVCDHVVPHRGNAERFWAGPFQTLCTACHSGDKQRFENQQEKR